MAFQTVISAPSARETVLCHVCSSADHLAYLEARGYRIVQCQNCGLWYVNPQPTAEELCRFYAGYDDGEQWRAGEQHFNRAIRKVILRFKPSGKLLDIGCGSGDFMACMREAGFAAFGIEPSESGCAYAREAHGIPTFWGMVEDYLATAPGQRYDVITLLNVLEHLPRPRHTLVQLRQLLRPEGLVAVVVPDARFHDLLGKLRRRLRLRDPYWLEGPRSLLSGFKLPDHLSSFGPRTISLLLERCGFAVESVENAPVVFNPGLHRNLAKVLVRAAGQALYYLTLGRVLCGYSTLVLARLRG